MVKSRGPHRRAWALVVALALLASGCASVRDPALLTSTAPIQPGSFTQCTFNQAGLNQCQLPQCLGPSCGLPQCKLPPCQVPKLDPDIQKAIEQVVPKYKQEPSTHHAKHRPSGVVVSPRRVIAPVGSEVVVLAGVCRNNGHLLPDENVQWMIAPGGVGHFLAVGRRASIHMLGLLTETPKKIDNTYAIGATSGSYIMLNRGTPTVDDDVAVQRGQAWITVTSPVEGTSFVTAYAPNVYGWDRHQQTSAIHWVDAQWTFPPAAINPIGTRHPFTTTVARYSDRTPVEGYRVRYEIIGGPESGFAPDGAKIIEVPTNSLGQATVEIFQPAPAPGASQIAIQVVQPANSSTGAQRLILGTGSTAMTWTSPDVSLAMTGPAQAGVGAIASYRITVTNPGDSTVRDVVVSDPLPQGMSHVSSEPAAAVQGARLEWRIGDVGGRQTRTIEVNLRIDQPGTFNHCATLATAEGLHAQDCVSTTVMTSTLDVRMTAPDQVAVGQEVTFQVSITNRGDAPATGLKIIDRFDAGFEHQVAVSPLEKNVPDIAPGQTFPVAITLRPNQAGQLCNTVDIVNANGTLGTARSCVNAVPAAPGQQAALQVRKTGPTVQNVGDIAPFDIDITNTGSVAVNGLKVADNYDIALDPIRATDGYSFVGDDLVWQIDTLPPGRTVRLQIQCRCQQPISRACNRVTVTTREGIRGDGEACLEIRAGGAVPAAPVPTPANPPAANPAPANPTPPPTQPAPNPATTQPPSAPLAAGNLEVKVFDTSDPVRIGSEVIYEIRVTNRASGPDRQLRVVAIAPPELSPVAGGTSGPARFNILGQQVEFSPVTELAAGKTLTYQVRMRANRAAAIPVKVEVLVSSQASPTPSPAEHTTTIVAGP